MKLHSVVGLVTNSSSETYVINTENVKDRVIAAFNDLFEQLGIKEQLGEISIEFTHDDDWIYESACDVLEDMLIREGALIEATIDDHNTVYARKYGRECTWRNDGQWTGDDDFELFLWALDNTASPDAADLKAEFLSLYAEETKDKLQVNITYDGEVTLYGGMKLKTASGVELNLDDMLNMSKIITSSIND